MIVLTNDQWFFATSNEWFLATSKKRIPQRVTSDFLQRATFATSNEWTLQRVTSVTSNERILQRVTSEFLLRATSAMSNEWIFATSNEQRVKSYASWDSNYKERRL